MKAFIVKERCASDSRICKPLKECPQKAISWIEDDDEPLGSRMEVDNNKCIGCGTCIPLCCCNCIELKQ
jgi:NAD-dependent dihydropyrimidine dehydrogenase PreA subunit